MSLDDVMRAGDAADAQLLHLVLATTTDAFVAIDEDGCITDWNPAAETIFGWPAREAVGRLLADTIVPAHLRDAHEQGLSRYLRTNEPRLVGRPVELPAVRRDGTEVPVELTITPLRVGAGWRFAAIVRDVGGRDRDRDALRRDDTLVATQALAGLGSWEWDLEGAQLTWSAEQARILGVAPDATPSLGLLFASVHPDDRERVQAATLAALAGEEPFEVTYRVPRTRGKTRVVQGRGTVVRDGAGRAVRMVGTSLDVTESEHQQVEARRLAAVVASTRDAVLTVDRDGRITSWNAGAQRLYGWPAPDVIGRSAGLLVPPDLVVEEERHLARVLAGDDVEDHDTWRVARDGSVVEVALTFSPVRDDHGRVVEASVIARDIGPRKRAERGMRRYAEDLEALARRDALTGLLNKRELHGLLDRELTRAEREGGAFSLLLVDVDCLATVNEHDGREAGDRLLRDLAEHVRACAGDHAACRAGGDELAVVVDSGTGARELAERIRRGWNDGGPPAPISIGTAVWGDGAASKQELLSAAVESLNAARPGDVRVPRAIGPALARTEETNAAERIVALLRRHLGMEVAYLSEFVGDEQVVRVVDVDPGGHPDIRRGAEVPLEGSYCRRMVDADIPNVVPDTAAEPLTAGLEVTVRARIGSYVGVPVRLADGRLYGTLCCASRHPAPDLDEAAAHFAHVCARFVTDLLEQRQLEDENRRLHGELTAVRALLAALDARDHYTGEHSEAVVALAGGVARRLGLPPADAAAVEHVALLHDIGKIGIPDAVLQKPGPLDAGEWLRMREHPAIGARIVATVPSLAYLAPAIRGEHERFDGTGYPDSLAGEDIPYASRIILACDAYHAMTSDRPYRQAMPHAAAMAELAAGAGTQFDPGVVAAVAAELEEWGSAAPAGQDAAAPRVLIVEDDPSLRLALEHGLAAEGFEVASVADAPSAYHRAGEGWPDLVLLDWMLQGSEGGPAACRRLRTLLSGAPVVMHTGLTDVRDRRAALEAGAAAFIEKGTPLDAVARELHALVGRYGEP